MTETRLIPTQASQDISASSEAAPKHVAPKLVAPKLVPPKHKKDNKEGKRKIHISVSSETSDDARPRREIKEKEKLKDKVLTPIDNREGKTEIIVDTEIQYKHKRDNKEGKRKIHISGSSSETSDDARPRREIKETEKLRDKVLTPTDNKEGKRKIRISDSSSETGDDARPRREIKEKEKLRDKVLTPTRNKEGKRKIRISDSSSETSDDARPRREIKEKEKLRDKVLTPIKVRTVRDKPLKDLKPRKKILDSSEIVSSYAETSSSYEIEVSEKERVKGILDSGIEVKMKDAGLRCKRPWATKFLKLENDDFVVYNSELDAVAQKHGKIIPIKRSLIAFEKHGNKTKMVIQAVRQQRKKFLIPRTLVVLVRAQIESFDDNYVVGGEVSSG